MGIKQPPCNRMSKASVCPLLLKSPPTPNAVQSYICLLRRRSHWVQWDFISGKKDCSIKFLCCRPLQNISQLSHTFLILHSHLFISILDALLCTFLLPHLNSIFLELWYPKLSKLSTGKDPHWDCLQVCKSKGNASFPLHQSSTDVGEIKQLENDSVATWKWFWRKQIMDWISAHQ